MVGPSGTRFILNEQSKLESINALNNRFAVVETAKQSGVLNLSLTGPDPDLIARSLDSITENYLRQNIDRQAAQDAKSLAFYSENCRKSGQIWIWPRSGSIAIVNNAILLT